MAVGIKITLNEKLYLRDPQETALGRNIIRHGILLIHEIGFEDFNFKKLAQRMSSTEASIYRYFENKHLLLLYLVSWYWQWVSFLLDLNTTNIQDPLQKLKIVIKTIVDATRENPAIDYVNEHILHRIVISESTKVYHTKLVDDENKNGFFLNYKSLSKKVADIISEVNPTFKYPRALASSLFEMANNHIFFSEHLPSLTEAKVEGEDYSTVQELLEYFVCQMLLK